MRAEEIENRVASVSLEGLNLARVHPGTSITASVTASSLASSSPPSGHSTPKLTPRSPAREMDRMGVMTLVMRMRQDSLDLLLFVLNHKIFPLSWFSAHFIVSLHMKIMCTFLCHHSVLWLFLPYINHIRSEETVEPIYLCFYGEVFLFAFNIYS